MINEIVELMVSYGTSETLYGNYCFEWERLANTFEIELNKETRDDIIRALGERKEISYIDEDEEEISLYFYTDYCPNLCDDEEEE